MNGVDKCFEVEHSYYGGWIVHLETLRNNQIYMFLMHLFKLSHGNSRLYCKYMLGWNTFGLTQDLSPSILACSFYSNNIQFFNWIGRIDILRKPLAKP